MQCREKEQWRIQVTLLQSELWPVGTQALPQQGCRLITLTQNKGTCPALPCPRNWESSAAHSQVHAWESATGGLRQAKLVSQNCLYHHSFPNLPIFHWPSYLRHLPTEGRTHCQQEGKWKILQPRHFPDSEVIPVALQLFRKTMIGQAVQRNRLLVLN